MLSCGGNASSAVLLVVRVMSFYGVERDRDNRTLLGDDNKKSKHHLLFVTAYYCIKDRTKCSGGSK